MNEKEKELLEKIFDLLDEMTEDTMEIRTRVNRNKFKHPSYWKWFKSN